MLAAVNKLWVTSRTAGLDEAVRRVLHRLRLAQVNHSFEVFIREITDLEPAPGDASAQSLPQSLACREIDPAEIDQLRYAEDLAYEPGRAVTVDLRRHAQGGSRLFVGVVDGTVVVINAIHPRDVHLDYLRRRPVRLPEGVAYLNAALTAPSYRRRRIGFQLRNYVLRTLRHEGYWAVMLVSYVGDHVAIQWHLHHGFQRWGRVGYFKLRGLRGIQWTRLTHVGRRHSTLLGR